MSDKSGASVINTPSGGGAVSGMGETFSPDLFTGTGNFSVPIQTPPGRNGLQPSLTIGYSSGNGNGIFGLGWSLSVPGISLKTAGGIPFYDESKDTYILSGAEDLIATEKITQHITRFRPRTEGLFARIERHLDATNDYWIVKSKDGLTSYYGTPNARGNDPATVADPQNRRNVFNWKLSKTIDLFGNHIIYEYERDLVQNNPKSYDQLYLKQIKYADFDNPSNPKYLISIHFEYSQRSDAFSTYKQGFEIRTTKRCEKIKIFSHPYPNPDIPIRTYHFNYLDEVAPSTDRLPLNGVSMLHSVSVEGHDGAESEYLPPLTFKYSNFQPQRQDLKRIKGKDLPAASLANPEYELVDLFGNGLQDIVEINGRIRYWRNLGNGEFDMPRFMSEAPSNLTLADPNVQFIDANGDGRVDLMVHSLNQSGYFSSNPGALWDQKSFQAYKKAPSFPLADPNVKLIDLDGDGITDAIRSGTKMECFFNSVDEGWHKTTLVERKQIAHFPNINFDDPRVKWADMTGDGMQDIVLVNKGNIEYWPNLGRGRFASKVVMQNPPQLPYNFDPRFVQLGDVDGDGLADVVYIDHDKVHLWINQSGNAFSEATIIKGTPPITEPDAVRLTDLTGKGTMGLFWSMNQLSTQRHHMYYLDLSQGNKAYVLQEMNNNMGAITKVKYKSSIDYYLEDEKRPQTRWLTTLPFPVQVVSTVEVIDELSNGKLTTEYSYRHGYWDGGEREFRGFGNVIQRDTEDFYRYNQNGLHGSQPFNLVEVVHYSPPTETRNWFHLGPVGQEHGEWQELDFSHEYWQEDPAFFQRPTDINNLLKSLPRRARRDAIRTMRGTPLRTELYALDNHSLYGKRPYSVSESLPGVRLEFNGNNSVYVNKNKKAEEQYIFFPLSLGSKSSQWERGTDPMTQCSFTTDFDAYGQAQLQIAIAVPRGRNYRTANSLATEAYLATVSKTTFINKDTTTHYLCGRVAKSMSYEVVNDGTLSLLSLKNLIAQATLPQDESNATFKILSCGVNYFDGDAFTGLPYGQIGNYGVQVRSESLVLTDAIISSAYGTTPLPLQDTPTWTSEYPTGFQNKCPNRASYVFHDHTTQSEFATGYYAVSSRVEFDFQDTGIANPRGLVKRSRDPLDHESEIFYDNYDLLPIQATQKQSTASGQNLSTFAEYDYRTFQAKLITDPNGNRASFAFSPIGMLLKSAIMGKTTETLGDDIDTAPGVSLEYDFFAFLNEGNPVWVKSTQRQHHTNDTDVALPERNETIVKVDYSDGFGRLLQTRAQAEDVLFGGSTSSPTLFGDSGLPLSQSATNQPAEGVERQSTDPLNVIVSGWQVYNNKGAVVEQYEPFFDTGFDYTPPVGEQEGAKIRMYYDPRGQVVRTINPDNSEQLVVFGIPNDISNPPIIGSTSNYSSPPSGGAGGGYLPSPWETYTYDANDNAGRTHAAASAGYNSHWNTPSSALIDALGRTIKTIDRLDNSTPPLGDEGLVTMRYLYDIQGNLLQVTDPLNRVSFQHVYDLAQNALKTVHLDSGTKTTIIDALGRPLEARDSKGALVLNSYDELNRPENMWAKDDSSASSPTLRQHIIYGDSVNGPANPETTNHLGKPYQHYDEAGLTTFNTYDFKGNLLEKTRQVIADSEILDAINAHDTNWKIETYRVDWEGLNLPLEGNYTTTSSFDGLNRVKKLIYPEDVDTERKELIPTYNNAGALEKVSFDGVEYVKHIAYDSKGQRLLIAYGNNTMTRYAYDPQTFALKRQLTEGYAQTGYTFTPQSGTKKQDTAYNYDLANNILQILERTTDCGIQGSLLGSDALDRSFAYDPLYRLLSATGRESDTQNDSYLYADAPTPGNPNANHVRAYTRSYEYDKMGNVLDLTHTASGNNFTRHFNYAISNNNHHNSIDNGQSSPTTLASYVYDANGNQTQANTTRHYEWDYADRLKAYYNQAGTAEPTVHAHYLYDAGGNRIKKLVRTQGGNYEVITYIDGAFEYHKKVNGSTTLEKNELLIEGVARQRVGTAFPDDVSPALSYDISNNIGSSTLRLDENGTLIDKEEYYPFGDSSLRTFTKKRYRYVGKEKDAESGLYYYGARYYAAWTCRFISCDPKSSAAPNLTPYHYCSNNPINRVDPDGMQDEPSGGGGQQGGANSGDTGSTQINGIKATPEGAEIYMRGFEKTLGDINPFSYDQEKGSVIYDSNKLEEAKNIATCEQLEIIDSAALLIDNGESTINIVDWNQTLAHRAGTERESLKAASRAGETVTKMGKDGNLIGADIYIARDAQVPTGEKDYIGAKHDFYGNMTSFDKEVDVMRNLTPDEISIAALHELGHPYVRVTRPDLNNPDKASKEHKEHNRLVESFEDRVRAIYQTGTKEMSTRVKGFGKIRYSVPTYMGGKAHPH